MRVQVSFEKLSFAVRSKGFSLSGSGARREILERIILQWSQDCSNGPFRIPSFHEKQKGDKGDKDCQKFKQVKLAESVSMLLKYEVGRHPP
jgi:hypothetical protein